MTKLNEAIAKMRMVLAEIREKEASLNAQRRQFQAQLDRVPRIAIYSLASIESSLGVMEEVQAKRELAAFHSRQTRETLDPDTLATMRRLERLIDEASVKAARTLTSHQVEL